VGKLGFLVLLILPIGFIPVGLSETFEDKVNSKYNQTLWGIGANLKEGDSYVYKICDNSLPRTVIDSHCYYVELYFIQILESWSGPVWIVQGVLNYDDANNHSITKYMIFQINPETFEVYSDRLNFELANSLENTIFSLSSYQNKSLIVGTLWDKIDSYFTNSVPLEIKRQQSIITPFGDVTTFVLGYDVIEESSFFIDDSLAFPIRGDIYSPHLIFPEPRQLFYYELISFHDSYPDGFNEVYPDEINELDSSNIFEIEKPLELAINSFETITSEEPLKSEK
jgi:hypothetical protein